MDISRDKAVKVQVHPDQSNISAGSNETGNSTVHSSSNSVNVTRIHDRLHAERKRRILPTHTQKHNWICNGQNQQRFRWDKIELRNNVT